MKVGDVITELENKNNAIVISKSLNPWFNLSLEEYLVNNIKTNQVILYLWQNNDTIVIGRNQNPWKECNINKIRIKKVKLARRLSGGGAVYHDIGNLNFTFIMEKNLYDLEKQLSVILDAVNMFNLNAKFSGRNDILIHGKKFSGNAYYFGDYSSYHHGTILVNTNISKLSQYLKPSKQKIISKGINSIKSRVINLQSINKCITINTMKSNIIKCFEHNYSNISKNIEYHPEKISKEKYFKSLYNKYSSWNWIYGESPSFDIYYENKFEWGEIQIGLNFANGYINNVKIYSDALNTSFVNKLKYVLIDTRFSSENIKKAINCIDNSTNEEDIIFQDILNMF